MIAYDYDSNCILIRAFKNKLASTLEATIAQVHDTLTQGGCRPMFHRLDNECPAEVKQFFKDRKVQYQLAPPSDH
jgi:phage terminase small subunit